MTMITHFGDVQDNPDDIRNTEIERCRRGRNLALFYARRAKFQGEKQMVNLHILDAQDWHGEMMAMIVKDPAHCARPRPRRWTENPDIPQHN